MFVYYFSYSFFRRRTSLFNTKSREHSQCSRKGPFALWYLVCALLCTFSMMLGRPVWMNMFMIKTRMMGFVFCARLEVSHWVKQVNRRVLLISFKAMLIYILPRLFKEGRLAKLTTLTGSSVLWWNLIICLTELKYNDMKWTIQFWLFFFSNNRPFRSGLNKMPTCPFILQSYCQLVIVIFSNEYSKDDMITVIMRN